MKNTKRAKAYTCIFVTALFMTLISTAVPAQTVNKVSDVSTVTELRDALKNKDGAHVRLTKDIIFTTKNAEDEDFGVILGEGHYTLDLNGCKIEYNYIGKNGDPSGISLSTKQARCLTINGPGSIVGGVHAVDQDNQFGVLIVNSGTFNAVIGSGIRMRAGIAYINGGTVTGNFYGVFHDDGIVVLNGGDVKSVVKKTMGGRTAKKYGVIKNGIFTGDAILEDIVLVVDDLTIAPGSNIRIIRGGGLVVKNSFVNNGSFAYESGLKCIGRTAEMRKDFQVRIMQDMSFDSLSIRERARLSIENGATVTVTASFSTEKFCSVLAENGTLRLLGSIDHKGYSSGVPELEPKAGGP